MSRVTVWNVLDGGGGVASLDRVHQAVGLRWSWTQNGNLAGAGRDLATRRRPKSISRREMAARLGVSPQTVQTLESCLSGAARR